MEFVRRAMQTRHNAYKNTQRLMKLASLLQVCHGESVEGVVWDTLARSALQVDDISASRTACNNFILAGTRQSGTLVTPSLGGRTLAPTSRDAVSSLHFLLATEIQGTFVTC